MRPYFLAFGVWLFALSAARANAVPVIVMEPGADPSVGFMLVNADAGIPQNGALLFEGPYNLTLMVDVFSAQGTLQHEGTLTPIEDSPFWVWVPEEPLPLGTLEVNSWSSDLGGLDLPTAFEVVPAIELGRPELMFAPSASSISVISNKRCCRERLNNSAMLIDGGHCFGVESESSIQVDPGVLTSAGQLQANQYLFRFSIGPDARATFTTASFRNVVLPVFTEQADEYCFEVSAIELPTLQELSYDELATCAEHGDLEALGTQAIEPSATELSRVLCSAPPTGYEDAWCDVNDDCGASEGSCKFYPHFCEGEPLLPLDPQTGLPVGDGDGDGGGDGDGDGDEGAPDPSMKASSGGGCAAATARGQAPTTSPLGLLGALIGLVLLSRRRSVSEPTCAERSQG